MKKVHFIGIGGVGMSATAKLLKDSGIAVTGSDEEIYPPMSDFLAQEHFDVHMPYAAANIPPDADTIIIGKNAKLVPETNAEVAAAYASGKPVRSFPEILAQVSKGKETVVVAGSYGKSTLTSILAHCLEAAGKNPSYFIGASPLSPSTSAKMNPGELFILEGDEYPSSNTDPRAKFLHYHPSDLIITPLTHDHLNIFRTSEEYLAPFEQLITLPPSDAAIIICAEGPLSGRFLGTLHRPVVTYGLTKGDFTASNIVWGERTSFDIMRGGAAVVRVSMTQLGEHNIQNIVGAAAFVFTKHLMTPQQFASAIASFKGIRRRMDRKSDKTSVPVFEGFGSAYEKMRSAIAAMRRHFPARRLIVIFEPNTFSWRNRESLPWYDTVFEGAARVYIFNPPHDGKETQLSAEEISTRVNQSGVPTTAAASSAEILALLGAELQAGDAILLSSSGGMGGLIESVPKLAEQKFPA